MKTVNGTEMPLTDDQRLLVDVGDNLWFPLLKYVRSLVSKGDSVSTAQERSRANCSMSSFT